MSEQTESERLNLLEVKATLIEDVVDELNRTVFRQQQQIDLLQDQLRFLYGKMQEGSLPAESRNLREEIPPHY